MRDAVLRRRRAPLALVLAAAAAVVPALPAEARESGSAPVWSPDGQCFRSREPTPDEVADSGVPAGTVGAHETVLWAGPDSWANYRPGCVPPGYAWDGARWDGAGSPYRLVDCTGDLEPGCFWYVTTAPAGGRFVWSRKAFVAGGGTDGGGGDGGGGGSPDPCPEPQAPAAGARVVAESADRRLTTVLLGDELLASSVSAATADLRAAAARRGFAVSTFSGARPDGDLDNTWLEDLLVPLSDGSVLVPGDAHLDAARSATRSAGLGVFGGGRPTADVLAMAAANGLRARASTVFVEGGNLLTTRGQDGEPLVLVGRSSLHVAAVQRQLQGCTGADADPARMLEHARGVLATELGVAPSRVVDIDDGGGHIDMVVRPGPAGTVLVDDPRAVLKVLQLAQRDPDLTDEQRQLLDLITPNPGRDSGRAWDARADLMREVGVELERAGLRVVPVPGVVPGGGVLGVNFMNGVMATDAGGRVFYLTNGTKTRHFDKVDLGFERAFQESVAALGVEVEFLPTGDLLGRNGGLDCVTVEQAVEPAG